MFQTSKIAYWCCQLAGWGLIWGFYTLKGYYVHPKQDTILIICITGFLATHLLRTFVRRYLPPVLSFRKEGLRMLLAIFLTTALSAVFRCVGFYLFLEYYEFIPNRIPAIFAESLFVVLPWVLIYWFYRLVVRDRARMLERRQLEWRLREMQTHADESGITMEGLMDEIGRIIKLIDENPARARSEITAFSRLLREGYLE